MYQKWGYEYLGPVLAGYCEWLYKDLQKKGIKSVFFLSRDGDIMRKAFVKMGYDKELEVHYLCVSRKSLRAAYLYEAKQYEDFIKLLPLAEELSIKDIADYFYIPFKDCMTAASEAGLDAEKKYGNEEIFHDRRWNVWWSNIKPCVKKLAGEQYEYLKGYFLQENFVGTVAIVDIGWRGNMQLYLETMRRNMGISGCLEGYYLGLNISARSLPKDIQDHMQGYLFFEKRKYESIDVNPYIGLLELLFTNKDGSASRYAKTKEGRIIPLKDENELIAGHKDQLHKIEKLQLGALQFVEANGRIFTGEAQKPLEVYKGLHKRCLYPNREMLQLFGDFYFKEDKIRPLFETRGRLRYLGNISLMCKDFTRATWKSGFLKSVIGFAVPYSAFFRIYYRIRTKGEKNEKGYGKGNRCI